MDKNRRDVLGVLTTHEARIEKWLRIRGIPKDTIPDLRQEVYEKALEYLAERELTSAVGGLLRKIARSVAAKYFEQAAIHARAVPKLAEDPISPSNPEQDAVERQMSGDLESIISTFDVRSQEILRAKFIDELSPEEIAESLNVSLSTVKRHVALALSACFAALQKKGHHLALAPLLMEALTTHDPEGSPPSAPAARAASSLPASFPQPAPSNFWQNFGLTLSGAAAGGIIVYLLMRSTLAHMELPPIIIATSQPTECTMPAGIWENRALTCPEAVTAPPPPAPPPPRSTPTPAAPKSDATPRLRAQAAARALEEGDYETAKMFLKGLEGPFADEIAAGLAAKTRQ